MPDRGERTRIVCFKPPVRNVAEEVHLWECGDEASVLWSGYWEGLLERHAIGLVAAEKEACEPEGETVPTTVLPGLVSVGLGNREAAVPVALEEESEPLESEPLDEDDGRLPEDEPQRRRRR